MTDELSQAVERIQNAAIRLRRLHASMHQGRMKVRYGSIAIYLVALGIAHIFARAFNFDLVSEVILLAMVGWVAREVIVYRRDTSPSRIPCSVKKCGVPATRSVINPTGATALCDWHYTLLQVVR